MAQLNLDALHMMSKLDYFYWLVNLQNNMWEKAPLHIATEGGSLGIVKYLIEKEAKIRLKDRGKSESH